VLAAAALVGSACSAPGTDRLEPARRDADDGPAAGSSASPSPEPPEAFSFAVIGDFGTGMRSQRIVARRMCRWRRDNPYGLVVTTGDNIYPDGSGARFQRNFFDPYACLLDNGVRFRAVLGNHDVLTNDGRPELDEPAFGMRRRNYVFRRAGIRFVMMNTTRINRTWLEKALEAADGDAFTIVAMHHPVFSPGKHGSTPGLRPELPRLFRAAGVDLVLAGHDHLYSVTRVLRGIRYVVTGGGGAPTYACRDKWFVDVCRRRHHFLYVTADGGYLRVRAVSARGRIFDRFRVPSAP
jgi:hypothetical protein